jgi:O-acetylserine/cysteine efflux transporter
MRPSTLARPAAAIPAGHIALLILVQAVWGGNFVVSKLALDEIPPLLFIALRFAVISLLLLPFIRWHRGQMRYVFAIAISGGAAHFGLMILSLDGAGDMAPIAIAMQLGVPFATLLSVVFLGERLGVWRLSALFVSFSGIVLMGFDPAVFNMWAR